MTDYDRNHPNHGCLLGRKNSYFGAPSLLPTCSQPVPSLLPASSQPPPCALPASSQLPPSFKPASSQPAPSLATLCPLLPVPCSPGPLPLGSLAASTPAIWTLALPASAPWVSWQGRRTREAHTIMLGMVEGRGCMLGCVYETSMRFLCAFYARFPCTFYHIFVSAFSRYFFEQVIWDRKMSLIVTI